MTEISGGIDYYYYWIVKVHFCLWQLGLYTLRRWWHEEYGPCLDHSFDISISWI